MVKVTVLCVGKIKEKFYTSGIEHYKKRMGKNVQFNLIELPDEKAPENLSAKEMLLIKAKEGDKILQKIERQDYVIALAIEGKMWSTEKFKAHLNALKHKEIKTFVFIIGGSLGLDERVMKRSNEAISFSLMTYPHQLMRVVLLEQLTKVIS